MKSGTEKALQPNTLWVHRLEGSVINFNVAGRIKLQTKSVLARCAGRTFAIQQSRDTVARVAGCGHRFEAL